MRILLDAQDIDHIVITVHFFNKVLDKKTIMRHVDNLRTIMRLDCNSKIKNNINPNKNEHTQELK